MMHCTMQNAHVDKGVKRVLCQMDMCNTMFPPHTNNVSIHTHTHPHTTYMFLFNLLCTPNKHHQRIGTHEDGNWEQYQGNDLH